MRLPIQSVVRHVSIRAYCSKNFEKQKLEILESTREHSKSCEREDTRWYLAAQVVGW